MILKEAGLELRMGSSACDSQAVFLNQVHGNSILENPREGQTGDGMIFRRGQGLPGLQVADCLPVFAIWDSFTGAAHAGWRGIAGGIVEKLLSSVNEPLRYLILGPCICPDCYEVGEEVRAAAAKHDPLGTAGHPEGRIDLRGSALRRALQCCPEPFETVSLSACTMETQTLFSYRRNKTSRRNHLWLAEKNQAEHIHRPIRTDTDYPSRGE